MHERRLRLRNRLVLEELQQLEQLSNALRQKVLVSLVPETHQGDVKELLVVLDVLMST